MISAGDIDFRITGVSDAAAFVARSDSDLSMRHHLIVPDKSIVPDSAVVGKMCSAVFQTLWKDLGVALSDLAVTVTGLNDAGKVLNGGNLAFMKLTLTASTVRHLMLTGSAYGYGIGAADITADQVTLVRAADFQSVWSGGAVEGSSGFRNLRCKGLSLRKSVFEQFLLDRVSISNTLTIDRCTAASIVLSGGCELTNLNIRGVAADTIAVDYTRVSLAKNPTMLVLPLSMSDGLRRLQAN